MQNDIAAGDPTGGIPRKDNFSFAAGTTYGCGGTAHAAFFPRSEREAVNVYLALKNSGKKFCILGCGSNVLAHDGLYDGYVVSTSCLKGIWPERGDGGVILNVLGGTRVAELLNYCKMYALTGLEFLAGIPASIGGLVYMNGGADGHSIGERVHSVRIFDGDVRTLTAEECCFTYKHSTMRDITCLILGIKLQVERSTAKVVATNISRRLCQRRKLPRGKSCGCVFENYCGVSAGKIIENAGLAGMRHGGAFVSPVHANFIINGGGSSADVYTLIQTVKSEVFKKFGITLKEEVCYIGDFE